MSESREQQLPEKLSILIGIISLGLTIYFSKNELFQVIFVSIAFVGFATYFILKNSLQIEELQKALNQSNDKVNKMEESLNIYERLLKLEKEVFKNAKK